MDRRKEELERIEKELLAEEDTIEMSVEEILADEELNALLDDKNEPAFDDPEEIREPEGEMQYNNFANDYGKEDEEAAAKEKKDEKIVIGLMIASCVLCLGIIGVLIFWLNMLS